jgi:hypothetical protein
MKPFRVAALVGLVAVVSLVAMGCQQSNPVCGESKTTQSSQTWLGAYDQDELQLTFVNNGCNTIHASVSGPGDVDPKAGRDIQAGKSAQIETHVFAKDLPYTYTWKAGDQSGSICLNKGEEISRTICIGSKVGVGSEGGTCGTPMMQPSCPTLTPTCPPAETPACGVQPPSCNVEKTCP